jgi:hypothetical protein
MSRQQRVIVLEKLKQYFTDKGKILTQEEYIEAEDKPYLFSGIRKVFRSYPHMLGMLKQADFKVKQPVKHKEEHGTTPIKPIVQPKPAAAVKPAGVTPAVKEK